MKTLFFFLLFSVSAYGNAQTANEQLELAERDFQRATLERGVDGWNSFFADSGAQLQNTSRIVRGHAAIKELMGEFLASKTERLIWWPVSREVGASGDMAYTFGASGVVSADSTGQLTIAGRGTYLTVWRKQRDGRWLVTADMGGQARPAALAALADTAAVKAITNIELARSWAIQNRDRAEIEKIYAYDFLGISANGNVVDRTEFLSMLRSVNRGMRYRSDVTNVSVAGETGIVTGILYAFADNITEARSSFLHVYTRRAGKWVFIRGISNPMKK
jgi:ketosteroid isomerase-like protein